MATLPNPNEYIIFEADQVLTNDNLNELFIYLDQQNRWTRNKLLGVGIASGLQITSAASGITISSGSGITSQGYLVLMPTTTAYGYYMPYAGVVQPADLPFPYVGSVSSPPSPLPFFQAYCTANPGIYQLVTTAQTGAVPLSSASINLNNYAVVLFLEMSEAAEGNCTTQDCDNGGSQMTLTVRPLLVPQSLVVTVPATFSSSPPVSELILKRYNVPYSDLDSSDDVINAFTYITDSVTLSNLALSYNYVSQVYNYYTGQSDSSFSGLGALLTTIQNNVLSGYYPQLIQYYYDFINDLVRAYDEFSGTAASINSVLNLDENAFPLHLSLGAANANTNTSGQNAGRQYFISAPQSSGQSNLVPELGLLYQRMILMVAQFQTWLSNAPVQISAAITRITPGKFGAVPLSNRPIPYYYDVAPGGVYNIYQSWDYLKTKQGRAAYNLSYNANKYASPSAPAVINPLLYDIEQYDFFRVEGHIGRNQQTVLAEVVNLISTYNLPFDVVSVSAESLSLSGPLPQCQMSDLDDDYRMVATNFIYKVFYLFDFLVNSNYPSLNSGSNLTYGSITISQLPLSSIFRITNYKKGDFASNYCTPAGSGGIFPSGTFGALYMQIIGNNPNFTNPVTAGLADTNANPASASAINYWIFNFIDAVESLLALFVNDSLSAIDVSSPTGQFLTSYQQYLTSLTGLAVQMINEGLVGATIYQDNVIADVRNLLFIGTDLQLQTLKATLASRLQNYQGQVNLLNYFKNNPGLEHKAGVPKGGTLVLVYHEGSSGPSTVTNTSLDLAFVIEGNASNASMPSPSSPFTNTQVGNFNVVPVDPALITRIEARFPPAVNPASPPSSQYAVINDTIIADFYIPYLCCSSCAPVAYIVQSNVNTYTVSGGGPYCAGSTAPSVTLSGSQAGVNYQLCLNGLPIGGVVAGTGSALNFGPQATPGQYTVLAGSGTPSTIMNGSATVTVNQLPAIQTVNGGGAYCSGGTGVAIGLNSSQTGVNYQLYNGNTLVATTAGTGGAISFGNQTETGTYTVVAKNAVTGCSNTMSGSATVSTNPLPYAYPMMGGGYSIGGQGVPVGMASSAIGVNYQLYLAGTPPTPVGQFVPGTGAGFNFGAMPVGTYFAEGTNATTGCTNTMTGTIIVRAQPTPAIFNVIGGGGYCSGGTGVLVELDGSELGVSYQLYYNNINNNNQPIGTPQNGTGSALSFGPQTGAGTYTVVGTESGVSSNMRGSVLVTINPLPSVYSVTLVDGGVYCPGSAGVAVGLSGSDTTASYQLYLNGETFGSPIPGTGGAISFGLQTEGTYTVKATFPTGCTSTMSGSAVITASPQLGIYTVAGGGAYCSGGAGLDVTLSGSDSGVSYQLFLGGVPLGPSTPGTGSTLDFGLQTIGGTYTVVATNTSGCTSTMYGRATIVVNPSPNVYNLTTNATGSYCSGDPEPQGVPIGLSGSDSEVSYELYVSGGGPVGSAMGTGEAITFPGVFPAGNYTAIATSLVYGCTSNMIGATVTMNQSPAIFNVSSGIGLNPPQPTSVVLSGSEIGVSYNLLNSAGTIVSTMPGTGSFLDFLKLPPDTYTVTAVGAGNCGSTMKGSATIQQVITGASQVCNGGSITLSASIGGGTWSSTPYPNETYYFNFAPPGGSPTLATVNSFVTVVSPTVVVVSYEVPGSGGTVTYTYNVTINPNPGAITGGTTLNLGGPPLVLSCSPSGGTWSSSNINIASVSSTGVVTQGPAAKAGETVTISYGFPSTGCISSEVVTLVAS